MCLGIPGKIIWTDKMSARVDIMGIENTVNIQLIESPQIGEYILIHAGCAIQKINSEHFEFLQGVLIELLEKEKNHESK